MYKAVFFCQLAVLLAVTCGQVQNRPISFVPDVNRPSPSVNLGSTIQEELLRTEALIRHEMDRLRQLQLQQATLGQEQLLRPVVPQASRPVVPQAPREMFTPAPAPAPLPTHRQVSVATTLGTADDALHRHQAESAHYNFNAAVNDGINDNTNVREETRDGLNVRGLYSYSDGFYKRTVHYEADENGYRVVKETVDPIGNGPQYNDRGSADVSSQISGFENQYHITTDDIAALNPALKHHQHHRI